ncbi:MAG: anti-phage ZorAB system protein ZorA [Pseudomonadota bacterium]
MQRSPEEKIMQNDSKLFDFSLLIPDWASFLTIFRTGDWTLSGFSAAIVFLLLAFGIGFSFWSIYCYVRSRAGIRFYNGLLAGVTQDGLSRQREDLKQRARGSKKSGGLWLEFDETLVVSPDSQKLWNTVDADYFFNASTLARGLVESRLIAAVPGFLTAIGVIGTFSGLQLGLAGLDLLGSLDESTQQMQRIINGASVAFLTSVWGVATSVAFNFFEKALEQNLRRHIHKLQQSIDELFPRIRAEQLLVKVEEHNRLSLASAQGLAEQIGDRMQQATVEMAEKIQSGISASLESTLGPAIDRMIRASEEMSSKQAESSEQALGSLIETFTQGLSGHADGQRKMMEDASSQVAGATTDLRTGMAEFLSRLDSQVGEMKTNQFKLNESVAKTITAGASETRSVVGLGNELIDRVTGISNELVSVIESMQESSTAMRVSTDNLNAASGRTEAAAEKLSVTLQSTIELTNQQRQEAQAMQERIKDAVALISDIDVSLQTSREGFQEIAHQVRVSLSKLNENQQAFLQEQKSQVTEIAGSLQKLLNDYGDTVRGQTAERLNEWNIQTAQYLEAMQSAIGLLNDTVNEMQEMQPSR